MNSKIVILLSLLFSPFASYAEVNIEVFGRLISLSDDCFYVVQKEAKGIFSCPSDLSPLQTVSFQDPAVFKKVMEQFIKDKEKIERDIAVKGEDIKMITFEVKGFNSSKHYLRVFHTGGQETHVYNICDNNSCIEIFSENAGFVQRVISQITIDSLYN
jgi:hypothetical protein